MLVPLTIIGSLCTAAPAEVPPKAPPSATIPRIAAITGVSEPSRFRRAKAPRFWLPPPNQTALQVSTRATVAGSSVRRSSVVRTSSSGSSKVKKSSSKGSVFQAEFCIVTSTSTVAAPRSSNRPA